MKSCFTGLAAAKRWQQAPARLPQGWGVCPRLASSCFNHLRRGHGAFELPRSGRGARARGCGGRLLESCRRIATEDESSLIATDADVVNGPANSTRSNPARANENCRSNQFTSFLASIPSQQTHRKNTIFIAEPAKKTQVRSTKLSLSSVVGLSTEWSDFKLRA
jgi:hypothetical protein